MGGLDDTKSTDYIAIAEALNGIAPGLLPEPVFLAVTRLMVTPVVEVVPLRSRRGETEIFLIRRSQNDPVWGGLLHVPGTVVRSSDMSLEDALGRVIHDELDDPRCSAPVFVGNCLHLQKRGKELAATYWIELDTVPSIGAFFPVTDMPRDIVETQLDFIHPAIDHFHARMRSAN